MKHEEVMKSDRSRPPRCSCEIMQIFVKAAVGKTVASTVTLSDKAKESQGWISNNMCCSTDDVCMSSVKR